MANGMKSGLIMQPQIKLIGKEPTFDSHGTTMPTASTAGRHVSLLDHGWHAPPFRAGSVAPCDIPASISKARAFAHKTLLTGTHLDKACVHSLENTGVNVICSQEIENSKKGAYPLPLYNKETKGCHAIGAVWLKLRPLTTITDFETTAVHEFTHVFDKPVLGRLQLENAQYSAMNSRFWQNMRDCARYANRNARGKAKLYLAEDYARLFMLKLKQFASDSVYVHDYSATLKCVLEGRARMCSALYMEHIGNIGMARQLVFTAQNNILTNRILGLGTSVYDIGLSFMSRLSEIAGKSDAFGMTLDLPPNTLFELANPEEYAKKASEEKARRQN